MCGAICPQWETAALLLLDARIGSIIASRRYLFCRTSLFLRGIYCNCMYASRRIKLITLKRPFTALTSNTIGSLTRAVLTKLGVDAPLGPHTTRAAFVEFPWQLELPSEVVASIGNWENLVAFSKHYLRAGASGMAKHALDSFLVHNTSPENVGSSDVPHTHREPALQATRGGSGTLQEHTSTGEPNPPPPPTSQSARTSGDANPLFLFVKSHI